LSEIDKQIPVIIAAREIDELPGRCLFVDNVQAAYDATNFLIDAGHKRIAHIKGMSNHQDAVRRTKGFIQAMTDANLEIIPELMMQGDFGLQSGLLAVESMLTQRQTFSAIFAANDQMAMGARLALYRRGIRVPDDISLIGMDDQTVSGYMTPPLTTIRQPATKIGEAAARAMINLLKNEPIEIPEFSATLIIRESVARYR
jgi:LacI family transcriptional regulator